MDPTKPEATNRHPGVAASMQRIVAVAALALTVCLGLGVRAVLAGFWAKYLGVALWSVALYAALRGVWVRTSVPWTAGVALAVSWAVELLQRTPVSGWLAHRNVLLRLVFGEYFSLRDLPAYAAGAATAAACDALLARLTAANGATTGPR